MSVARPERIETAMPFPESPRVIYGKNPLVEVICQLRFPTILRIGRDQPADFQERVRQQYPLYALEDRPAELPKELASILAHVGLPRPSAGVAHRFETPDSQRLISLCQDFVALTERKYTTWELFRNQMAETENAIRQVYSPAFYSRIGLRYRDVISRSNLGMPEAKWTDLLQPQILGELGSTEVSDAITSTKTQSVIRLTEIPGAEVSLAHGLVQYGDSRELCYMIDADFYVRGKDDSGEPFGILDTFNRLAGRLFRWAITDALHRTMGPQSI